LPLKGKGNRRRTPSWQKLKEHVEARQDKLQGLIPEGLDPVFISGPVDPADPQLAQLFEAIAKGDKGKLVELLRQRPALAKARDFEGQTPLHNAARYNDPQMGMVLLAFGADLEAAYGESQHTPLSWAVTCCSYEFARAILKVGAKGDLFCAAGLGELELVRACFDERGNLKKGAVTKGSTRYSPEGAVLPCPPESAKEQISDALYLACRNAHPEVVACLLEKQPDLGFRAYLGATPLHWAYFGGSATIIEQLIGAGADPMARDDTHHLTPRSFGICVPVAWGFSWRVERKLAQDPSLVECFDRGTSPLHFACRLGHMEIAQMLLAKGADWRKRDEEGKRPIDLAREKGHYPIVAILEGLD